MTVIGITGPTGAGKTTLLREIERLGGEVIDCDAVYHQLLEEDAGLQEELERAFGPLREEDGSIDRKKLGAIVFGDPAKLERLNGITQRATAARVRALLEDLRGQGSTLAAVDAIALLESGRGELCDTTVAVVAPPEARVARIMAREGIPEDYAWSRVRAQRPAEYFVRGCDHALVNDHNRAEEFGEAARKFLREIL